MKNIKRILSYSSIIFILFLSCVNQKCIKNIELKNISIEINPIHPFLREYERTLTIQGKNDYSNIQDLNIDSGSGCNAYIFDLNSKFILIDCNSSAYEIDKKCGKIRFIGSYFEKELPNNYLGTYRLTSQDKSVVFTKD